MVPTATRLNPAASRRMSSPAPGQEFGKVENSLCTFGQYGPEIDGCGNPQMGEVCVTPGAGYSEMIPRFSPSETACVRSLAPSFAKIFLIWVLVVSPLMDSCVEISLFA